MCDCCMHKTARICAGITLAVYNINCFVDKLLTLALITNYTTNYSKILIIIIIIIIVIIIIIIIIIIMI